jgi:hypothetical protein
MATIEVNGQDVVLQMSRMEALEAMHAHTTVTAPMTAVQSVEAVDDAWPHLRGMKETGTELPGKSMIGTKVGEGFKDFCVVHKDGPAVIVSLDPAVSEYSRWVFTGTIDDVPPGLIQ